MSKIIVNYTLYLGTMADKVALGKARQDSNTTFERLGFPVENLVCKNYKLPLLPNLQGLWLHVKMLARRGGHNEFYYQYPTSARNGFPIVARLLHVFHNRIVLIIHDVQSLRYHRDPSQDIGIFNSADLIIAHTEPMRQWLIDHGVKTPIVLLHIFDYYSEDDFLPVDDIVARHNEVVFAGNLRKSEFLPALCRHPFSGLTFNLYGLKGDIDFSSYPHIKYCGVFQGDHTGTIHGGWGLVWDGDSITTCDGVLGDYLRYNLPHKLSLYIAAGLPVIVWSQSAVADWVKENHLGLVVDSLEELPERIAAVTEAEHRDYIAHCREMGSKLRNGEMLKARLSD